MKNKFYKYLTDFYKNHKSKNPFLRITESWKAKLNNRSNFGVKIMDLSKAFDSFDNDLLLAKLEAYGLDKNTVCSMRSYLINSF